MARVSPFSPVDRTPQELAQRNPTLLYSLHVRRSVPILPDRRAFRVARMKFIEDAVPFERPGWEIATITTSMDSLHAIYLQAEEIVCLGVETAPDVAPAIESVSGILAAVERQLESGGFAGDHGVVAADCAPYDALGHLSGSLRMFADGWGDDGGKRVVHVFPCFQCEFGPNWKSGSFVARVRANRKLFEVPRPPYPSFDITMRGMAFSPIVKWAPVNFSTLLTYVPALADDPEAELSVRNVQGSVLTFNRDTGWSSFEERILVFACAN